ncbi:MAG: hypothetical protein Q8Q38_00365 [bacterium]|nr:hypothetical protein [bacterium]MDZ4231767.1 hypothetical protein [Candidatus Pacearchaeota archaeon]
MDQHTIFTIFHILGVAVGAGGAFLSDAMFFSSVKDERISRTEMRFLFLGGKMVWIGIAILLVSGLFLVFENPQRYLASSKFLAKMTIVAVIILNGAVFHLHHIPRLYRHAGHHFPSSDEFMRKAPFLLGSGVVSVVSWVSALVLGASHKLPYGYFTIMAGYLVILALALVISQLLKKRIIAHPKKRP